MPLFCETVFYIFNMFVITDQSQRGSLFTLFLNNPLMAFLFVSGLSSMRRGLWEKCQEYLRKINRDIAQLLTHSRSIGTLLLSNCTLNKMYYPGLKLFKLFDVMVFAEGGKLRRFS